MARVSYPADLGSGDTRDYIKFEFGNYTAPYAGGSQTYSSSYDFTPNNKDSIYLYMPNDINSSFGGKWAGADLTGLAAFALGTVSPTVNKMAKGDFKGAATSISNLLKPETLKTGAVSGGMAVAEDAIKELANSFGKLPGLGANLNYNNVLQLSAGVIVNPNTELMYGGPSGLRQFGYSFKLIPQSKQEASNIIKIVETFKKACAPKKKTVTVGGVEANNFIGIPDICRVSLMGNRGENPYLPRYKPSAITSVTVNYVTDGQFGAFRDGEPIGVNLTVSFTELKLIYEDEIGGTTTTYR